MFLYLLFSLTQGKEKICICNGECSSLCSYRIFNATSQNPNLEDSLISRIQNEEEIELTFYSNRKDFTFAINPSLLHGKKITFKALKYSFPVTLKIKPWFLFFSKNVEIKPNYEVSYPNLVPFKSKNNPNIKNIHTKSIPEPLSSTIPIPISVGIAQMNPTGDPQCAFLPGHSDYPDGPFNPDKGSQEYYCNYTDLEKEEAYRCGWRCYGENAGYSYTFRGVKFAIYGTFDPNHRKFYVQLDGEIIQEVDENNSVRMPYSLLYQSEILEYKDHEVKIIAKGELYEFYKLTYWPSMTAKRVNSSAFSLTGDWKKESDGIGGFRHYKNGGGPSYAIISLQCRKFWLYGVKFSHLGDFTLNYNGTAETIKQGGSRNEGVLLYESPELENTSITINFQANGVLMIYCIYYEEANVPISVSLKEMEISGPIKCGFYYPGNNSVIAFSNDISSQDLGCEYNNLNSQNAYTCGLKCWTETAYFYYTFKGVKFAVYGTYNSGHGTLKISVDDVDTFVDESIRDQHYAMLYQSDILEYKDHYIKIVGTTSKPIELYKIVYWPSITAKRLNATDLVNKNGVWATESDGIGGNRQYSNSQGGSIAIKLHCSKFWIYGYKDVNYKDIKLSHNGIVTNLEQRSSKRIEGALLYESPQINTTTSMITLQSNDAFKISCIFYEEIIGPIETPIPISVGLKQMTKEGTIENCGTNKIGTNLNYESTSIDNLGCNINNLNIPDAYNCGLRCWGNPLSFSYTFTGVKFAVYGTYERTFGTVNIDLDGNKFAEINVNFSRLNYELIYESEFINYKQHTVKIYSNQLYEVYKLVYWPSMRAKRKNSTQFTKFESEWYDYTDGIGGIKEMSKGSSSSTLRITVPCRRFWFYGSKNTTYNLITLTIDGSKHEIKPTDKTENCVLLYDSGQINYRSREISGTTIGCFTFNCLYYEEEVSEFEYINKTFIKVLPYTNIYVAPNSIINQISGCNFINIYEDFDYFIQLEKPVSFFDNNFQYEPYQANPSSPINVRFNGELTIKNCTFTNAKFRGTGGANVFYCGPDKSVSVTFDKCKFINCGTYFNQQIINIQSSGSSLKLIDSYFESNSASPPVSVLTKSSNVYINDCYFYKSSQVKIEIESTPNNALLLESPKVEITGCVFDQCKGNYYCCFSLHTKVLTSITFEDNVICNNKIDDCNVYTMRMDLNDIVPEIEIRNISFTRNSCFSQWGGGCGATFFETEKIAFINCSFENNEAKQSTTPRNNMYLYTEMGFDYFNGDGGAIQFGFSCFNKNVAIKFEDCIFSNNKATRHGGAIAVQTTNEVEIINCTFNMNKADENLESSSASLLAENHYNKKGKGRGGAIYINPTFSYSDEGIGCKNSFDSYMKSITIKKCTFVSNSAYDGYSIYVEGEDLGTKFDFQNNKFDDNYNFAQSAKDDPNITVRGVIATEIHSISSESVLTNNVFSNVRSKKLIYVDHYGTRIGTNIFSESAVFTFSQDFTKSAAFTNSAKFTKSGIFSDSKKFSSSIKFTETEDFTNSKLFSNSIGFSESKDFTHSGVFTSSVKFSESKDFTHSGVFTSSVKFSESKDFTHSGVFTSSVRFSESKDFTHSGVFTSSVRFSESKDFTHSGVFTSSIKFSESKDFSYPGLFTSSVRFSESKDFTHSGEFSNSIRFSKSDLFTGSSDFSQSGNFISLNIFSSSDYFSSSPDFSDSKEFSKSKNFLPSIQFTGSMIFSASDEIINSESSMDSSAESDSSDELTETVTIPSSFTQTVTDTLEFADDSTTEITSTESHSATFNVPTVTRSSAATMSPTNEPIIIIPITQTSLPTGAGDDGEPNVSTKSEKKIKLSLIIGLVVGIIALLLIIILIIIFIVKRRKQKEEQEDEERSIETRNDSINSNENVSIEQDFANPLYNHQMEHDPFDDSFEECI